MASTISVIRVDLDAIERGELNRLTTWAEREEAARRRQPADTRRFLARRATMRLNAAAMLRVEPADIVLAKDALGRPEIPGGRIHVSQSSRGSMMIAAFCLDRPVGCDLEEIRGDIDMDGVAAMCLGPTEQRLLHAAAPSRRLPLFYDLWTRKEAYLKATGTGMTINMATFETTRRPGPATAWGRVDWTSESWNPTPDHIAALVARGDDWTLVQCEPARSPRSAIA
jgi:4'-phosphopantetheinyl transferase